MKQDLWRDQPQLHSLREVAARLTPHTVNIQKPHVNHVSVSSSSSCIYSSLSSVLVLYVAIFSLVTLFRWLVLTLVAQNCLLGHSFIGVSGDLGFAVLPYWCCWPALDVALFVLPFGPVQRFGGFRSMSCFL